MDKACEYNDLLRTWLDWWHGPAKCWGVHDLPVIPPVTNTLNALACTICAGIEEDGRCEACGRALHGPIK